MNRLLTNLQHWRTSAVGFLALIAVLPQNPAVQQFMTMSPKMSNYILGAAGAAAGLMLIFGAQDPKKD